MTETEDFNSRRFLLRDVENEGPPIVESILQAIAWFESRRVLGCPLGTLGSPELAEVGMHVGRSTRYHPPASAKGDEFPTTPDGVGTVVLARRNLLWGNGVPIPRIGALSADEFLSFHTKGSVLAHLVHTCSRDELPHEYSPDVFDYCDFVPPDCWIGLVRATVPFVRFREDVHLSWMPEEFLDLAQKGIECTTTDCLFWVDLRSFVRSLGDHSAFL